MKFLINMKRKCFVFVCIFDIFLFVSPSLLAAGYRVDFLYENRSYRYRKKPYSLSLYGKVISSTIVQRDWWKAAGRVIKQEDYLPQQDGTIKTNVMVDLPFHGKTAPTPTCDDLESFYPSVSGGDGRYVYTILYTTDPNPNAPDEGIVSCCGAPMWGGNAVYGWWLYVVRKGYKIGMPLEEVPPPWCGSGVGDVFSHMMRAEITWSKAPPYNPALIRFWLDPDRVENAWKSPLLNHGFAAAWRVEECRSWAKKLRKVPFRILVSELRVLSWTNTPYGRLAAQFREVVYPYADPREVLYRWDAQHHRLVERDLSKPLPKKIFRIIEGRLTAVQPCELKDPKPRIRKDHLFRIADFRFQNLQKGIAMLNYGHLTFWTTSTTQVIQLRQNKTNNIFFAEVPVYRPPGQKIRYIIALFLIVLLVGPIAVWIFKKISTR